jgi:hypothetical protein
LEVNFVKVTLKVNYGKVTLKVNYVKAEVSDASYRCLPKVR